MYVIGGFVEGGEIIDQAKHNATWEVLGYALPEHFLNLGPLGLLLVATRVLEGL